MDPVSEFLACQDGLIARSQALLVISVSTLRHQLGRRWMIVLPGVYAGFTGALSDRQRKRAALLYAGKRALLADVTSLADLGVRFVPQQRSIHVQIPSVEHRASRGFVVVRRTHRLPPSRLLNGLPYCPPERALVEASARLGDQRTARAMIADAVQRQIAHLDGLEAELPHLSGRGSGVARRAISDVLAGARSAPECDFLDLCRRDRRLPEPLTNPLLRLPGGRTISPDALFLDAGLVHETNGRGPHAHEDGFEDMQERHDAMTTAGLTVLHNAPRQLRLEGTRVTSEVLACYQRLAGRGLPPGVILLRKGPPRQPLVCHIEAAIATPM
jgi:hypothetical protein